jgi:hypothetical protein
MRSLRSFTVLYTVSNRPQRARIDAEEGQRADEGIGRDLERQRRERRRRRQPALDSVPSSSSPWIAFTSVGAGRYSMTASSIACTPLFLNAEPHEHRDDLALQRALAQPPLDLLLGERLALEVLFRQLVGGLGSRLDEVVTQFGTLPAARPESHVLERGALIRLVPEIAFIFTRSIDAFELVLGADRQLDRHRVGAQPVLDLVDHAQEVGAGAVHLVDERDARHAVLVGLAPHRLGLRLHTRTAQNTHHRAVEHAQRTLDFDREVDVPGVSMMLMRCSGTACPCPSRSRWWPRR